MNPGFLYLDSSVLVSLALQTPGWKERIREIQRYSVACTSELAFVECQSGIEHQLRDASVNDRTEVEQRLNRIFARLEIYGTSALILGQARALIRRYRTHLGLRTLDAIHVATANLVAQGLGEVGAHLEYWTADQRQHAAFSAEGHVGKLV